MRRLFCHLHISYSALRTTESVLPIRWKVLQVVFTLRFANALWWSHSDCAYITACLLWVASCAPLQLETRMSVGFILSRILNLSLNQGSHYRLSVTVHTATACVLYFAYCQCSPLLCFASTRAATARDKDAVGWKEALRLDSLSTTMERNIIA